MPHTIWRLGDGEYDFKDVPQDCTIKIHGVWCGSDRTALRMAKAVSSPDSEAPMVVVERRPQAQPLPLKAWLCHYLNSLHIFCGLVKLGLSRKRARVWARGYERIVHPFLY